MSTKPFDGAPDAPKRDRSLLIQDLAARQADTPLIETVSEEGITKLFDSQAFVMNKATALLRELEPRLDKVYVPVDKFAVQVRRALGRKGLDPDRIPFSLYKEMYITLEKRARSMKFEIVGDLTGDPLVDHQKITENIRSGGKGLSRWQEFLMTMEPWLLWFLLNQLTGQFQCQEHQEACAAKTPPGTEVGPISIRMAISMAAMMLIMGMQEEHVLFALKQPQYDVQMPGPELLDRARRLIESDGMHRDLKEIIGAADPYLIIQYCDNYVARHPEGYSEWLAFRDLRNIRREVSISHIYAHQYKSGRTREIFDYKLDAFHQYPTQSPGGFPTPFPKRGVTIVDPESLSSMSAIHFRALTQQVSLGNRDITAIGGVLTSGFALDVLCCFSRFFLKSGDMKTLRKIRTLIAISQGAMTGGLTLPVVSPEGMMNWVMQQIYQEMIAHVQRAFDHQVLDVTGWLNSMDPELMEDLAYCPFILDLLNMINQAVNLLQSKLQAIISRFLGQIGTRSTGTIARWGTMYDIRRGSALLAMIDRILEVAEACAKLEEEGLDPGEDPIPDPGEDETFYNGVPRPLKLPAEVVEKFFASSDPIERPDGGTPIPAVGTMVSMQEVSVTQDNYRRFCLGIMPDRVIDAIFGSKS